MAEISAGRVRRRPRLGWMDGEKVGIGYREMTVDDARKNGKSGEPWIRAAIFPRPRVLSDRPPVLWWFVHTVYPKPGEGWGKL